MVAVYNSAGYLALNWNCFGLQEWISMNYWTSHKETAGSTMTMSPLWLYRLKEEFGSHQESTFDNFIHRQYSL